MSTDTRTAVRDARAELDIARERFERTIRDAYRAGASLRAIAREAGLTHQRIHQLVSE